SPRADPLSRKPYGVITFFGGNRQIRASYLDLNLAMRTAGGGTCHITQSVLIASIPQSSGIGALNRLPGETREDLPPSCARVFGKNVAIAKLRQVQPLQLAVNRNRCRIYCPGIHHDSI